MADFVDFKLWWDGRLSLVKTHVIIFPSFGCVLPNQRKKELGVVFLEELGLVFS